MSAKGPSGSDIRRNVYGKCQGLCLTIPSERADDLAGDGLNSAAMAGDP